MADTFYSGEATIGAAVDEREEGAADDASEKLLEQARKRFQQAKEAENEIRTLALDDLKFIAGEQWPDAIKHDRELDGRPCLVVNRLPQFVQQITNDQRQNRPAIKVHPLDNAASEETAEVIQGLVRHIAYNSNADIARDRAFDAAARCGFGYYRVTTGYVAPDSFDQEIYIKSIRSQFSVFLDPFHQEPDGSDVEWAFIIDELPREQYEAEYPHSKLVQQGEWDAVGNQHPDWVKNDSATVAEYFYKEYQDQTIHLLSTGETVKDEDLGHRAQAALDAGILVQVVRSRKTKVPVVKWVKMNAAEILEETVWPGSYIPIIPVYGQEYFIDGRRVLEGIVRNAKDPQRMLNFWKSAEAEAIALAPRAPFIGVEGQFEGYEHNWKSANRKNHAFLEYKPVSIGGQPAPPPQRSMAEPAVQAITQASMAASEDLKATTGIYDAALGAQSNEIAGVAIKARSHQAQTSNFHLTDNLNRSMKHEGRILVDLIPHIYDSARAARIIGDDGTHKVMMLNQEHEGDDGKEVLYDVTVGRYDVTVDTGPSYASRREEAAASMIDLTKAAPQLMQVAPDLVVKSFDFPGAQELADRFKRTLPPNLQDGPQKDIPPQVQAMLAQQDQMIDQMTKALHEKSHMIEQKQIERDMLAMELQNKKEIEVLRLQTEAEIQLAKINSQDGIALLKHQVAELMQREQLAHQAGLQAMSDASALDQQQDTSDPTQANGAQGGADFGPHGPNPTGGMSPGSSMEGN